MKAGGMLARIGMTDNGSPGTEALHGMNGTAKPRSPAADHKKS